MSAAPPSSAADLAGRIDHTLLRPEADAAQVRRFVEEALTHPFAALCVHGVWAPLARRLLDEANSATKLCVVVDFPLGCAGPAAKAAQALAALEEGAEELDVVVHPPACLAGDAQAVEADLAPLTAHARRRRAGVVVKAIVETAALERAVGEDDEALAARLSWICQGLREVGVDFVKTSTGLHEAGGASVRAVRLLRRCAGSLRIKASGGVRTLAQARALLEAGADRLGASASLAILEEAQQGPQP